MTQYSSGSGSGSSGSSGYRRDFKNREGRPIEEKLMVAVRVRPPMKNEVGTRILRAVNNRVIVDEGDSGDKSKQRGTRQYLYDVVFGEESSQEKVYEGTTKPLVQDLLNGYNATVFAYGATGAGKTHTMVGVASDPGIMVRTLNDIFQAVRQYPEDVEFKVSMSYMEIYNENIRDLLNPNTGYLELREDTRGRNVSVANLTEITTISTEEVMQMLQRGNKARTIEPTAANETSSRSHALLSVTVRQSPGKNNPDKTRKHIKQGKLFMIDLAGSERAKQTKNQGKRLQEGAHINRSLLALGNCINALSGGARYVNFRDSKLTRLLKEALSGNCRTVMIAHVSPAKSHKDESKKTLMYADRANKISNKIERNVLDVSYLHASQYENIISDLKNEITRLRTKVEKKDSPSHVQNRPKDGQKGGNADDFKLCRDKIVSAFKEQMRLRRKLIELDSHLLGLNIAAEQQHSIISQWECKNNKLYKSNKNIANMRPITGVQMMEEVEDDDDAELEDEGAVQHALSELAEISREQQRSMEIKSRTEQELQECRQKSAALEDELPSLINSDEERELLALMLRVHELEADKMMLQSERLVKQHELRRRELLLLRYDRQRQISDEIITRQRRIMEDGRIMLPSDLQDLYSIYQQEIHASTYETSVNAPSASSRISSKLPPISRGIFTYENVSSDGRMFSSSTDSDWDQSPLPPIQEPDEMDRVMGPVVNPMVPSKGVFPPISSNTRKKTQDKRLRRIASDDSIGSARYSRNEVRFEDGRKSDEAEAMR